MVARMFPSFLTYAKTQILSPCFASISLIYISMAFSNVSEVSKNLIITWQSSHLSFKKWTIKKNVSTPFPWHPKIKKYSSCITWLKGWRNFSHFFLHSYFHEPRAKENHKYQYHDKKKLNNCFIDTYTHQTS